MSDYLFDELFSDETVDIITYQDLLDFGKKAGARTNVSFYKGISVSIEPKNSQEYMMTAFSSRADRLDAKLDFVSLEGIDNRHGRSWWGFDNHSELRGVSDADGTMYVCFSARSQFGNKIDARFYLSGDKAGLEERGGWIDKC